MSNQTEPKRKYKTAELVQLFDHFHNSTTAIIIADTEFTPDKHQTIISAMGNTKDLKTMVYLAMKQSDSIAHILSEAVLIFKAEQMLDKLNKEDK